MEDQRPRIGIVGGGLMGLTLALRLAQRGESVTLLEGADHVGGLADAWELGDVTWDRHYHVTLLSDLHWRAILAELSLDEQMKWVQTRTGFLTDGKLVSMSNSWEFLNFPPLGLLDKLRLGWTIFHASRLEDADKLEQISVGDWLTKHSGRRTFERIWLPLLKAKLGDAWQRTSAAFIWATIQRMYAARRTGLKREMFGYLPGGYRRILDALSQRLEELGVDIRTGCKVQSVERDETGHFVVTLQQADSVVPGAAQQDELVFDRVVMTTAASLTARMCPQLTPQESACLNKIEYLGIVCASLLLKKPLADYYVTNITDPAPFTGVIEMTALVDPAEFGGRSLVYLPKYATADDEVWTRLDDDIRAECLTALARLYPNFSADDVLAFRVSRVRHVFALTTLNYSQNIPPVETSLPGLFVVNSAQIARGTLNVNETVRLADSAVELLCQPLSQVTHSADITHAETDRELVARPR